MPKDNRMKFRDTDFTAVTSESQRLFRAGRKVPPACKQRITQGPVTRCPVHVPWYGSGGFALQTPPALPVPSGSK